MMVRGLLFRVTPVISIVAVATIATACSGPKVTTKSSNELSRYTIRSIAVMPFTALSTPQARDQGEFFFSTPSSMRRSDISISVPSAVDPLPKQTMAVPEHAAENVTKLFWGRLQGRKGVHVLPPGESVRASSADGELAGVRPEKAAAAVAKRLKVDAALIGLVSVYQEREGSRMGANPPASVGFDVKVVAADGEVLWVGNYYERQHAMNEDLIGFFRGWGFLTAAELAEYGVDELVKKFPFGGGEER